MAVATDPRFRIGIDLGGTKIEGLLLGAGDAVLANCRVPAPRDSYDASLDAIADMVAALEADADVVASVGIGVPGSISPVTGLSQGSNSTWLNAKPLKSDIERRIGRGVRMANDANCFALSEARDGAGAGARSVFGIIIGTGCGGGIVLDGKLVDGPNAIGGEWGHNPLPWSRPEEHPGPVCWCGRAGCLETWVSGTGLAADHLRITGETLTGEQVAARAEAGDLAARSTLDRHASRLARGIAHVVNMIDPEVIVLGGGLSKMTSLYPAIPALAGPYIFAAAPRITVKPPRWGDASGVRGAAHLW